MNDKMKQALIEIRKMAMDHPCFMDDEFRARNIDAICNEGGDCCDWTMVAILADDALKEEKQ